MGRKRTKFPYCRVCNKTRNNPDEWATKTVIGKDRKYPACGECGRVLSWNIRKTQNKIKRTTIPNNVEQNLMTKTDIKDNLDFWNQFRHKFQRKP